MLGINDRKSEDSMLMLTRHQSSLPAIMSQTMDCFLCSNQTPQQMNYGTEPERYQQCHMANNVVALVGKERARALRSSRVTSEAKTKSP